MDTKRRIGVWSAMSIVLLSLAYVVTVSVWVLSKRYVVSTQGLQPSEPFLAILETLILLFTPAVIGLFAAIHAYAPDEKKSSSLAAFGFTVLLAGITGVVHFVQLTSIRRTSNKTPSGKFKHFTIPPANSLPS
jgi:hypothetical protein